MVMRSREDEDEPPAAIASQPPRCRLGDEQEEAGPTWCGTCNTWEWKAAVRVAGEARGAVVEEGKKAEHWLAACRMRRTTMGRSILHMIGWLEALAWSGREGHSL